MAGDAGVGEGRDFQEGRERVSACENPAEAEKLLASRVATGYRSVGPQVARPSPPIGSRGPRKRGCAPVTESATTFTRASASRSCSRPMTRP